MARVLVLGGGFGGITAALTLAAEKRPGLEVTLVDRRDHFLMGLAKLAMLTGDRRPEEGRGELRRLEAKGVRFVQTEIKTIDLGGRSVETGAGPLGYDRLVVALGAETDPSLVPGLAPEHNFYQARQVPGLHKRLLELESGKIAIVIARTPYKCPPAPYEAALLLDAWLQKRGLRSKVKIAVYVPEAQPMTVAGPVVGEAVGRFLETRGIALVAERKLLRVDDGGKTLRFENENATTCDFLLAIAPHVAPAVVRAAGLTDATGWVPVDPATLETTRPGVWAVGDVTAVRLPGTGMLPKAGLFAELEGRVVAERILADLDGRPPTAAFTGRGECYFETGNGLAMAIKGEFFGDAASRVTLAEPSEEAYRLKRQFERDRLAAWFG